MSHQQEEEQIKEITDGLLDLMVGKNIRLSIIAALSIAATSAFLIGMKKLELQEILIRCYDKREKEAAQ